ncbi:MAG: hypothetical protein E6G67_08980 [Actinobacteria bacterium]|nr:MAG: hypothetical protein E6G67_08980 [Actinomycetota bacterium]
MVKAQAGILESDRGAEAEGKLEATVDGLVSDPDEARWIAGHLRALVGVSQAGLAARDRRSESFAAWRRFVEALAERNPVVLVFEDLHWADEGLLDFVDELVDWARGMPLLVLCTARPELLEQRPGWGGGKANALTVSLPPLGDDETARLLAALMERDVPGGNPLYAEQYVRMLAERGDPDLPLPETVQGIIAARLDALAPEEKTLVQDASVIGKVFWLGALQAIGGMARWDAEHLLHNLERKEFVQRARRASVASEVEFSFRHLLVRDVAYGQIPRAARGEKHRLIAEWLESLGRPEDHAEMLAHHYLNALEYGRAAGRDVEALAGPARTALREAGDRSFALSAFRGAVRLYEQALALWPEDDLERPEILFRYGRSLHMAAEPGEERVTAALGSAREAFLSAGEPDRAAEAEALLAWNVWSAGQRDRAREHLERATGLVGGRPDSASKAIVLAERSRFHMVAEENEDAVRVGREALALAERFGLEELQAHTLNNVGVARTIGGDTGGIGDLERAIGIAERIDSWEVVRAQQNLASVSAALGNLERARELHEAGLVLERERFGATVNIRWMLGELAADLYWAGEWDSALRDIDSFLHDYGIGEHYQEAGCRQIQALILLARDDVEPARADNLRAADLARLAKDPQLLYPVLAMGVFCALEMGFRAEAIETADELLGALAAFPGAASWSPYVGFFAHACVALGRTKELAQALAQASIESPWLTAATAVLSEEPGEAADMYEAIGSIPDEAYARLRAAEVLARAGRRAEADAQLGRALGLYRSVGAARYARQGEALLAASA